MISRLSAVLLAVVASLAVGSSVRGQCSGDINGDGRVDSVDLATLLAQWGTCPATISSVSPTQGSVLGGTTITITGTGLASTTGVTIGGVPCTGVTVLSGNQVRAVTPAGSAGQAAIAVTTPAGTSLAATPFTYVVQAITSIVPSSGTYLGGTPITIIGQYLGGSTSVTIGGVPAVNVVAVSATMVTAVTPPGSVGTVDVVVGGPKGSVSVPGAFTYLAASVPSWASLIEALPDPAIVSDSGLRAAMIATGYAWHVRDNATQIEMVLIPPGTFNMGCSPSSQWGCDGDENPVHAVTLTNPFYLGRYEVTQAQWQAQIGSNPSFFVAANGYPGLSTRPVERVSWDALQGFLVATSMRLPTEAEWEYACRAGTSTAFHGFAGSPGGTNNDALLDVIAWFSANSASQTRPVGGKLANGFGLHDISGNVWEWVNDWEGNYPNSPQTNPSGPSTGIGRVLRGGAWNTDSSYPRSSNRISALPGNTFSNSGFRVARNP